VDFERIQVVCCQQTRCFKMSEALEEARIRNKRAALACHSHRRGSRYEFRIIRLTRCLG
jgi:hypothetical protein